MKREEPAGAGWSREVLDFIEACRQGKLRNIRLVEVAADPTGENPAAVPTVVDLAADYLPRHGAPVPVRVSWTGRRGGRVQRFSVRGRSGVSRAGSAFTLLALRAGLLPERRRLAEALREARIVHITAGIARNRLVAEYLGVLAGEVERTSDLLKIGIDTGFSVPESREKIARHRAMALATLNDLARLHSSG